MGLYATRHLHRCKACRVPAASRAKDAIAVNAYVVYCHPDPDSFTAAVCRRAVESLEASGHQVRMSDLYGDGFEPAVSLYEKVNRLTPPRQPELEAYCDNLRWCDTLVFIYPTWWSGQPAMLTGWLDRVLIRGVAWDLREGADTNHRPAHQHSPIGDHHDARIVEAHQRRQRARPDVGVIRRAVRVLCHRFARTTWLAMYNVDRSSHAAAQRIPGSRRPADAGASRRLLRGSLPVESSDDLDVMRLGEQVVHGGLHVVVARLRAAGPRREPATPGRS